MSVLAEEKLAQHIGFKVEPSTSYLGNLIVHVTCEDGEIFEVSNGADVILALWRRCIELSE